MATGYPVRPTIKSRRSVRTFDNKELSAEDREKFEEHLKNVPNPFGIPLEFRILDCDKYDVSSSVITGEHTYFAAKVRKVKNFELAAGYSFEEACLYARSLGLGTVMLAATFSRDKVEKAMDLEPDEVVPVASPVGYASKKQSLRETVMRKSIGADGRKDFGELFFKDSFENSLDIEDAGIFKEALEMVRWAPSAANKQPWRIVMKDDRVHFYEKRTMRENALGDIQRFDVGIATCHFDLMMESAGKKGKFVFEDPGIEVPDKTTYAVSYKIDE